MNLMLLKESEVRDNNTVRLATTGRRARHVLDVLKLRPGDQFKAGVINGQMGKASITSVDEHSVICQLALSSSSPEPLDITLILGLPRPKMMRRVVQTIASLGVKDIIFINTYKVEKSYWQTPWLKPEALYEQCLLGLEQSVDTIVPKISLFKLFKPFVEDQLPDILRGREGWFAHPGADYQGVPATPSEMVLSIGPEGGFTPYEAGKLSAAGLKGFCMGPRILRVETVIPALLGKLYL